MCLYVCVCVRNHLEVPFLQETLQDLNSDQIAWSGCARSVWARNLSLLLLQTLNLRSVLRENGFSHVVCRRFNKILSIDYISVAFLRLFLLLLREPPPVSREGHGLGPNELALVTSRSAGFFCRDGFHKILNCILPLQSRCLHLASSISATHKSCKRRVKKRPKLSRPLLVMPRPQM